MGADVVLVPTFNRPEYLWLCLETIHMAEGGSAKQIQVAMDRHTYDQPSQELENYARVREHFKGRFAKFSWLDRAPHSYSGNSYNVFELYRSAMAVPDVRYIYLIEDDVLITPDFFKWHAAVRERADYFATVGWRCIRNSAVQFLPDPTAYIESTRDYASIGVCWKPNRLAEFVRHATPEYFTNAGAYLQAAFPGSPIPGWQWTEQDGIITRMFHETRDRWVAWPALPRCTHVGIQGYHRPSGHRFQGTLEQRVEELRRAVAEPGKLTQLSRDPFNDVSSLAPVPYWEPKDIHVTQRFEYEAGKI